MVQQYLYISTAPDLAPGVVDDILASCRRNNSQRGVTGLLLYNGRNFLQLLEGTEVDLLWVMRRIGADPRHSGISILERTEAETRACPDWSMRRIRLAETMDDRQAALDAQLPEAIQGNLRRTMLNFAALN
ncbi:MAG: BLUF domain-containing protein [Pontixanthobacter sp.]